MRILFLDDMKERHMRCGYECIGHEDIHAYTAAAAILMLRVHAPIDVAFLDHDLCEASTIGLPPTAKTGMAVVEAMERGEVPLPRAVAVHSLNPAGRARMCQALERLPVKLYRVPFGQGVVAAVLRAMEDA